MNIVRLIILCLFFIQSKAQDFNITSFGAKGDSLTLNTKSIQSAIDAAAVHGGTVIIPAGIFRSGTLYMKSHVSLFVSKGAKLIGSVDSTDYPDNIPSVSGKKPHMSFWKKMPTKALVYADNQDDISIRGEGTIDGNGGHKNFKTFNDDPNRPKLIMFINCRDVLVENVYLINSAFWLQHYFGCDRVKIKGITVFNHANHNNDGIDIDSRNVTISDCIIESTDDAICLKSDADFFSCENIVITNCVLASDCNLIKFGTASFGGFKNITVSNCVFRKPSKPAWIKKTPGADSVSALAGLALEIVDGGTMEKININNIVMDGVQTPIFIRLGKRNGVGVLKDVIISNIQASAHSLIPSSITAVAGAYVQNVLLKDIFLYVKGEGTLEDANRIVPDPEKKYPENVMFGASLPAYGLFIRHAKGITCQNIQFNLLAKDSRPAIFLDDVQSIKMDGCQFAPSEENQPTIRIKDVKGITLSNLSGENSDSQLSIGIVGKREKRIKFIKKWKD